MVLCHNVVQEEDKFVPAQQRQLWRHWVILEGRPLQQAVTASQDMVFVVMHGL